MRKIPNPRLTSESRIDEPKVKAFLRTRVVPWPIQKRYVRISGRTRFWYYRARTQLPLQRVSELDHPVFIIGSSRSGTGMLTKVLAGSDRFCYFSENRLIRKYMMQMVRDPSSITAILPLQRNAFIRLSGLRKNQVFLEKTPEHSLLVEALAGYYNNPHFLHIVRDGRDCALSMLGHDTIKRELARSQKPFWIDYLPSEYIRQWPQLGLLERGLVRWACFVRNARRAADQPSARYTEIRYEELCEKPLEHIEALFSELGQPLTLEVENRIKMISPGSVSTRKREALSEETTRFYEKVVADFQISKSDSDAPSRKPSP